MPTSARPRPPRSRQAKALRRRLLVFIAIALVVYTVAFALVAAVLDRSVLPQVGDLVADATSAWIPLNDEEADHLTDPNWQVIPQGDGTYMGRDLTLYYTLRSMRFPAAVVLYMAGCIIIVALALNRTLGYFDWLTAAVTQLVTHKEQPIELPDELAIVRADLTDARDAALASERAAVAAERRKNELVAYLAHDIRTPLTSVLGYLELLSEPAHLPDDARREFAGIAHEKAEHLDGLVEEFFEITRYNLQAIPIERQNIDLRMLCLQVAEEFYPQAKARSLTIEVDAPADVRLFADPDKLARALSNVVRNAVAYADLQTTVTIRASIEEQPGDEAGAQVATIAVTDRGREISQAHLQSIFDKFFREDGARGSGKGGAGLGLAIAREIVTAHGGDIAATSERGVTTFTISVPA